MNPRLVTVRARVALGALLLLVVASPAAAGIVFDSQASASTGAGTSTTSSWSHTVGSGSNRVLVVGISDRTNSMATSVTYGAQALTRRVTTSTFSGAVELWTLTAPASGTATITVTNSSSTQMVAGSVSFSGVDQTTTVRNCPGTGCTAAAPLAGDVPPATISTTVASASGDMVVDAIQAQDFGQAMSATPGPGQIQSWNSSGTAPNAFLGGGSFKSAAGATTTMSWDVSSGGGGVFADQVALSLIPFVAPGAIPTISSLGLLPLAMIMTMVGVIRLRGQG